MASTLETRVDAGDESDTDSLALLARYEDSPCDHPACGPCVPGHDLCADEVRSRVGLDWTFEQLGSAEGRRTVARLMRRAPLAARHSDLLVGVATWFIRNEAAEPDSAQRKHGAGVLEACIDCLMRCSSDERWLWHAPFVCYSAVACDAVKPIIYSEAGSTNGPPTQAERVLRRRASEIVGRFYEARRHWREGAYSAMCVMQLCRTLSHACRDMSPRLSDADGCPRIVPIVLELWADEHIMRHHDTLASRMLALDAGLIDASAHGPGSIVSLALADVDLFRRVARAVVYRLERFEVERDAEGRCHMLGVLMWHIVQRESDQETAILVDVGLPRAAVCAIGMAGATDETVIRFAAILWLRCAEALDPLAHLVAVDAGLIELLVAVSAVKEGPGTRASIDYSCANLTPSQCTFIR